MGRAAAACLLSTLLACGFAGAAGSAGAFSPAPPGDSPHDRITEQAARRAGFPGPAIDALQAAVLVADVADTQVEPSAKKGAKLDAAEGFEPSHHCDRVPPASDADSFRATADYVAQQRRMVAQELANGSAGEAMAALGRGLHAVQDCHSHSNVVDLPHAVEQFRDALLNGSEPPAELRLTGYLPDSEEPDNPPGDPYPHAKFAKDSNQTNDEAALRLPDGRTKHEAAVDLAVETTVAYLALVREDLPAEHWEALLQVEPDDDGVLPIPFVWGNIGLLAVAMAAIVWTERRFRA